MDTTLKLYFDDEQGEGYSFPYYGEQAELFDFTVNKTRMGSAPTITATLEYPECLDEEWGRFCKFDDVYVVFNGEKYYLKSTPASSKSNDKLFYKHDLTFVSERIVLENVYMIDDVENQTANILYSNNTQYTFFGNIHEFVERINQSMYFSGIGDSCMYDVSGNDKRIVPVEERTIVGDGYYVVVDDTVTNTDEVLVTLNNNTVSDALKQIFEQYNVPYYFVGRVIHVGEYEHVVDEDYSVDGILGAGVDNNALVPYEYGQPNAVLNVSRSNATKQIYNRVSGTGSSDNIPYYYPNPTPSGTIAAAAVQGNQGNAVLSIENDALFANKCNVSGAVTCVNDRLSPINISSYMWCEGHQLQQGVPGNYVIPNNRYVSLPATLDTNTQDEEDFDPTKHYYKFKVVFHGRGVFGLYPILTLIEPLYQTDQYIVPTENITGINIYSGYSEDANDLVAVAIKRGGYFLFNINANQSGTYTMLINYEIPEDMFDLNMHNGNIRINLNPNFGNTGYFFSVNGSSSIYDTYTLSEIGLRIDSGTPAAGDMWRQNVLKYVLPQQKLMPVCYRLSDGTKKFYPAKNYPFAATGYTPDTYIGETISGGNVVNENYLDDRRLYYDFANPYRKMRQREHIEDFPDIKPTIKGMTNSIGRRIDMFAAVAYDTNDDNSGYYDESGNFNYNHPYFFAKLRRMNGTYGFNLFEHAIDESEMTIAMTSGDCAPCEFRIMVDENTQKNLVQVDGQGNLVRDDDGDVICGRKMPVSPQDVQNDTFNNSVWLALEKDVTTYGEIMPYYDGTLTVRPKSCTSQHLDNGDTFVILHIEMPLSYVTAAEQRLTEEIIKWMYANNSEKFNYALKFSRVYLGENQNLIDVLNENVKVSAKYNGITKNYFVSSYTYRMQASSPIPEINIGGLVETVDELKSGVSMSSGGFVQRIGESIADNFGELMLGFNKPFTHIIQQNNTNITNQIKGDFPTDYVRTKADLSSDYVILGAGGNSVKSLPNGSNGQSLNIVDNIPTWSHPLLYNIQRILPQTVSVSGYSTILDDLEVEIQESGLYLLMAQIQFENSLSSSVPGEMYATMYVGKNILASAKTTTQAYFQLNLSAIAQLTVKDLVQISTIGSMSSYSIIPQDGYSTGIQVIRIG